MDSVGTPSDDEAEDTYTSLRRSLDSFSGSLPDFREAIQQAREKLRTTHCPGVSEGAAQFLDSLIASGLAELESFAWRSTPAARRRACRQPTVDERWCALARLRSCLRWASRMGLEQLARGLCE